MPNILIVGHGFVGQAVDYAFSNVSKYIVDPKYDTDIPDNNLLHYDIVFVSVPTPMGSDGSIDTSILDSVLGRLKEHPLVVVKSTVTPDVVSEFGPNVVYNPEFLTEKSANEQFVSAKFHILGGPSELTEKVEYYYRKWSLCDHANYIHMTREEASYVKYTINTFLAMKVTFFNQLFDAMKTSPANFATVIKAVAVDDRIGSSHTKVPGFDGKQGFGGACFPKDISAFVNHNDALTLLQECIKINNEYRLQYNLDDREIEQNVHYGKTKEKLEDWIDGYPV